MSYARSVGSLFLIVALSATNAACSVGQPRTRVDAGDAGEPDILPGCDGTRDSDADGVADQAEGEGDLDGDGTPNILDTDSDGDGISDTEEHHGAVPCALPDTDDDDTPNWADTDSDNDGLSDADERGRYSTDPYNIDSDGDTVTDLGEVHGTMTDPNDPTSTIPPEDFFVVLPYNDSPVERTLPFGTDLQIADIYFLIDTTGSMQESIDNVTSSLTRIAGEVSTRIPNVQMGVGQFRDFPYSSGLLTGYGSAGDAPFTHEQSITDNVSAVQSALGGLGAGGGADTPESSTEALYQAATGEGGSWSWSGGSFSLMRQQCPAIPDETGRRTGYPCFRPGALPIIVHVTDAQFHNGPSGANAYSGISPAPHNFDQALSALNVIGARYIGVNVVADSFTRTHEEAVARGTGSVDLSMRPLVYDATGGTVSDAIIEGIETLAGRTVQDVDTTTENEPGNPDDFDATTFIKAITPVDGYNGGNHGPQPGITFSSMDDRMFYDVVPGTTVEFRIRFHNDVRPPAPTAQIFRAVIVVRGNGVTRLSARKCYIVVPPDGAIILI